MTRQNFAESILAEYGPMRSSRLAQRIATKYSLNDDAARKQISRVTDPILRLPYRLLPKNETFLYRGVDRNTERYWAALLRDLRETGAVYGMAIDGLRARGGIAQTPSFQVVTGAPVAQKGQVPVEGVVQRLIDVGFLRRREIGNYGECIEFYPDHFGPVPMDRMRARMLAEKIIVDALREWARKLAFASYNGISIRQDKVVPKFSTCLFDMAGPSYLMPLTTGPAKAVKPGFLVADVFCDAELDLDHIQYFLRKVRILKSMRNVVPFLPILLADGFTSQALRAGRSAGVIMATIRNLFGEAIANSLSSLLDTLKRAAAVAATDPDRVIALLNGLRSIEGAAGNLRGALFELIVGYLVREVDGGSIDIGEIIRDPGTGNEAEIDVRRVKEKQECWFYECRGRQPTNLMPKEDVEKWIERVDRIFAFHRQQQRFQNHRFVFELWTTGKFSKDAESRLKTEKSNRKKIEIGWRDGPRVREYAKKANRPSILNTLDEHYFKHPLA